MYVQCNRTTTQAGSNHTPNKNIRQSKLPAFICLYGHGQKSVVSIPNSSRRLVVRCKVQTGQSLLTGTVWNAKGNPFGPELQHFRLLHTFPRLWTFELQGFTNHSPEILSAELA